MKLTTTQAGKGSSPKKGSSEQGQDSLEAEFGKRLRHTSFLASPGSPFISSLQRNDGEGPFQI